MVVVEPLPVQTEGVVAVALGLGGDALGAGFLLAPGEEGVRTVAATARAEGFVLVAARTLAGADPDPVAAGAVDVSTSGGGCDCCTSTFDEPLLHAATPSSRAKPAATVPVVRMPLTTNGLAGWFSAEAASCPSLTLASCHYAPDLSLRAAGEVGNHVVAHPAVADDVGDPVERCGGVGQDDENGLVGRGLDDVQALEPRHLPRPFRDLRLRPLPEPPPGATR